MVPRMTYGVVDHADYESDNSFWIWQSDGPGLLQGCHIVGMWDTIGHRVWFL
jgi:hypothetical protein